jgi:hypothetical protein
MRADMDVNLWGLIVVPLGLLICFWPVLAAAAFAPAKSPVKEERRKE